MKIGIEAQRVFRRNKHGMDYVVLEEIRRLQKLNTGDEYFIFVKPGDDVCLSDTPNCHIIQINCATYPLWEQWALPRVAARYNLDVLHCTSNTAPIYCNIPLVLTLHDIIFIEPRDKSNKSLYQNLGYYYRRFVVPRVLPRCRKIITVSNFEYNNIQKKLGISKDKLTMIYNGVNEHFKPLTSTHGNINKAPFLFLGNTDPKKNTERTIIAYGKYLEKSSIKRTLSIADLDDAYIKDILKRNNLLHIRSYIKRLGYVDNKRLCEVYNSSFAFLYTSLRESFGIPLLEAMACGTPVITSNTSSMPEIGGNDALLIDPENVDSIAEAMIMLENDMMLWMKQCKYGIVRAMSFSWNSTAENLNKLYHSL